MSDLPFLDEEKEPELTEAQAPEQPETMGEPEAATPAEPEPEPRHIPITALLDERDKRQRIEREAEELRQRIAAIEARNAKPAPQLPDLIEDPEGRLQAERQQMQQLVVQDRLQRSRYYAEKQHGAEFVNEVVAFFNDPAHVAKTHEFLSHPDPMDAAIAYYQRQKAMQEIGPDPAAYRSKLEAEIREKLMAEMAQGVQPKPTAPPQSLASAAAAGGDKSAPVSGFKSLFG